MPHLSRRPLLAGLAAAAVVRPALAAGGPEPIYADIVARRGRHHRVIHMFGDSVMRGWALGAFWDGGVTDSLLPPGDAGAGGVLRADHPLHAWRAPWSMARAILADSALPVTAGYGGTASPARLRELVERRVIRPDDAVVLQDSGPHGDDPVASFRTWRDLRRAVVERVAARCLLLTTFDYDPFDGRTDMMYDRPLALPDGRWLTVNQAIALAARDRWSPGPPGTTVLVDLNLAMDRFRRDALAFDGVRVMLSDGIHPNVWGQWLMVGEILKACGIPWRRLAPTRSRVLAQRHWQRLGYGTTRPAWTAARADAYLRHCLER